MTHRDNVLDNSYRQVPRQYNSFGSRQRQLFGGEGRRESLALGSDV